MRAWPCIAAVVAAIACAVPATARANPSNCAVDQPPPPSPRIVRATLDGLGFDVLLPADYATSARRYPVLYLLHGADYDENTWLDQTDTAQFTSSFTGDRAAIVVTPDGGPMGWYTDWYQGNEQWETYHLQRLVPYVDAHFRTLADRSHRAVAGFSMGGLGALDYAARHPDVFTAVGAFSAIDDLTLPEQPYAGASAFNPRRGAGTPGPATRGRTPPPYRAPDDQGSGCGAQNGSQWGDPVTDRVIWHSRNPTDLASNLRGVTVYVAAGNGVPCDAGDATQPPAFATPLEPGIRQMNQDFAGALSAAGVPHTTDFYGCGLHTMRYAQRDLHAFWTIMLSAFGARAPGRFGSASAPQTRISPSGAGASVPIRAELLSSSRCVTPHRVD